MENREEFERIVKEINDLSRELAELYGKLVELSIELADFEYEAKTKDTYHELQPIEEHPRKGARHNFRNFRLRDKAKPRNSKNNNKRKSSAL